MKLALKWYTIQASGPFRKLSVCIWQNAHANTVRCAMSIFLFLKFYNFIKGITHIHSTFKKPKTNVFILHLLTLNIYNSQRNDVYSE